MQNAPPLCLKLQICNKVLYYFTGTSWCTHICMHWWKDLELCTKVQRKINLLQEVVQRKLQTVLTYTQYAEVLTAETPGIIWTRPIVRGDISHVQSMNFLRQGFRKLSSDTHTYIHTDMTKSIYDATSWVVNNIYLWSLYNDNLGGQLVATSR